MPAKRKPQGVSVTAPRRSDHDAPPVQPTIAFANALKFRQWLERHHGDHQGIWMKIARKDGGIPSVTYAESLDEALCYGWIDGQKKAFDDKAWLQKFTRRGTRSIWSKANVGHIERLTGEGRMQAAGLAAVDAAKADGRWEQAYHSSRTAGMPADFMEALDKDPKARAFFDTLNQANRYAISFRLQTARKPETRARRLNEFIAMMQLGKTIHLMKPSAKRKQ
jgi:uncharacterized protein YdeI (YjbR/CyaY-like superfamily)